MSSAGRARSVTDRIRNLAEAEGIDPQRVRRRLVFQRILARVAQRDGWVLKGGFCLEVRLGLASRATKDLDLVAREGWDTAGALDLQDDLAEVLDESLDDGFGFAVGRPKRAVADEREVWRVSVEARLDGSRFAQVRLDVVVQYDETVGGTERLLVSPPLPDLDLPDVEVVAVDVAQHAAGKIHAYSRAYAGERPSSRVKDLVDLVLLIEAGVLDLQRLRDRLVVVYRARDDAAPPVQLPDPPPSWDADYQAMLAEHELEVGARTAAAAHTLLHETYLSAISTPPDRGAAP